jgi:Dullard-like phosphatase family protein
MFFSSKAVESIAVRKDVPDSTAAVVPGQQPVKSILYRDSCYGGPSKRRQNRNKRISMRPDLRQVKWIEPRAEHKKGPFFKRFFSNLYSFIMNHSHSVVVPQVDDFKKKLLVLDMDETLLHSVFDEEEVLPSAPDANVFLPEDEISIPVFWRPGVQDFLKKVSSEYEVLVWTAGTRGYAEPVLNRLDPNGYITTRLYRDSCTEQDDGSFLKDLSTLNRPLSEVIIVDNNPDSFALHPDNGIQCVDFYFDACDTELKKIVHFLDLIKDAKDVRTFVPQFDQWVATGHLNLEEHVDCYDHFEVDCCDAFEVSVGNSIVATVEDDAQEKLGSLFYIDEKGRQRRRSHRLLSKN